MRNIEAWTATDESYVLGEGPVWDDLHQHLSWVDITAGRVHRGVLVGRGAGTWVAVTESIEVDRFAAAAVPGPGKDLLVAGHHSLHHVGGDGHIIASWSVLDPGRNSRLNDGACDPAGRFLVGSLSLGDRAGDERLVRLEATGEVTVLETDLVLSNGLGWAPDGRTLWSIDSIPAVVWRRDYDPATGAVGPREEAFTVEGGKPDGMAVDVEGHLWIAVWGAGQVRRYHPDGEAVAVIEVPAPHTSSVAFVGPGRDLLLITTAQDELTDAQLADWPESGRLFLADPGITGLPTTAWHPVPSPSRPPR